jgi:hypothetical protein
LIKRSLDRPIPGGKSMIYFNNIKYYTNKKV